MGLKVNCDNVIVRVRGQVPKNGMNVPTEVGIRVCVCHSGEHKCSLWLFKGNNKEKTMQSCETAAKLQKEKKKS